MTLLVERDLSVPSIPEYYKGKTLFLTGGTGFIGKVLVEKLIYSCPDLEKIYLLARQKKGMKPKDRLSAIYASRCFDRLRQEKPGEFEAKVFIIEGDCSALGLGLSEEDRELVKNQVHIIYHAAASVRFDDLMKASANLNLRGTREIIELAKEVKNLECFVHVSTSFGNSNQDAPIKEVLYPPHADWRATLEICDNIDDHTLNILTPKYLGEMPNTYVFNKQLAEHLVYEQKGKLPIIIVRPSIVVSSHDEPLPGWNENFNGPLGLLIAGGKGILRVTYASPDIIQDYIPVDIVVKGLIAASWTRGIKKVKPTDDIQIFNICNGSMAYTVTLKEMAGIGRKVGEFIPMDNMLWTLTDLICPIKFLHFIAVLLLHVLPAIFLDTLLWLFGRKTMLLRLQQRIYSSNIALEFFLTRELTFCNENFLSLRSKIKEEDRKHFHYNMENVDKYEFMKNCILGARRYILKEKDEDLPKARAHLQRIIIIDRILKIVFFGFIIRKMIHTEFVRNLYSNLIN